MIAFEQTPSIEPQLRDLLRRVDGKTAYQQLVNQPGDALLFEELQVRQLVQVAPQQWRNSSNASGFTDSAPQFSVRPAANTVLQDNAAKKSSPNLSLVARLDESLDPLKPAETRSRPEAVEQPKIRAVKILMCRFVLAQLPEYADATLVEINALTSEAQLLCMLTGYINLVNRTGKAGQQHVQQVLLTLAGDE